MILRAHFYLWVVAISGKGKAYVMKFERVPRSVDFGVLRNSM